MDKNRILYRIIIAFYIQITLCSFSFGQIAKERYYDPDGYFSIKPPRGWSDLHLTEPHKLKVIFQNENADASLYILNDIRKISIDSLFRYYNKIEYSDGLTEKLEKNKFKGYEGFVRIAERGNIKIYSIHFLIDKTLHHLEFQAAKDSYDDYIKTIQKSIRTYRPSEPDEIRDWNFANAKDDSLYYRKYLYQHPNSKYKIQANEAIEKLSWDKTVSFCTIDAYHRFVEDYPYSPKVDMAKYRISQMQKDSSVWNRVFNTDSVDLYRNYIELNPTSPYSMKAEELIRDIQKYDSAKQENWYSAYEDYLEKFPHGRYADTTRKTLKWLKSHRADYSADIPSFVEGGGSPYINVSSPFFKWNVTFHENSGQIGYKINGTGWYYDNEGKAWGDNAYSGLSINELFIKPGGSETYETWFSGQRFVGGYILINFTGEDAGGHPVNIKVRIDCR